MLFRALSSFPPAGPCAGWQGLVSALCFGVRTQREESQAPCFALLFPSTFTSFSASIYFWDKQSHETKVNAALTRGGDHSCVQEDHVSGKSRLVGDSLP